MSRSLFHRLAGLGLVLFALAGCATRIDWTTRIGNYSFDDAVREYGPPERSATLTDGTLVGDWLLARGLTETQVHGAGGYGWRYRGHWATPVFVTESRGPDRILRLTFGPDKRLKDWRNVYR